MKYLDANIGDSFLEVSEKYDSIRAKLNKAGWRTKTQRINNGTIKVTIVARKDDEHGRLHAMLKRLSVKHLKAIIEVCKDKGLLQ
jgi:hypothetical protein